MFSFVRRHLAIRAYKARERKRDLEYAPAVRLTQSGLIQSEIKNTIDAGIDQNLSISDAKYFVEVRDKIDDKMIKLFLLRYSILIFIFLSFQNSDFNLQIFGFDLKYLKEFAYLILVFTSIIDMVAIVLTVNKVHLEAAIESILTEKLDPVVKPHYSPAFFWSRPNLLVKSKIIPSLEITKGRAIIIFIYSLLAFFILFFGPIFLLIIMRYYSYVIVYSRLSFNEYLVVFSFLFNLLVEFFNIFALILFFIPFKYRDYINNDRISLYENYDKAEHSKLLQKLFAERNADKRQMEEKGYL